VSKTAADKTVESSLPETSERPHHHYRTKAEGNAARKAARKARKAKLAKEYGSTSEDDLSSSRFDSHYPSSYSRKSLRKSHYDDAPAARL